MPELNRPWRLLRDGPSEGAWNMAVDEAIARGVAAGGAAPTLRLYTWAAPTVSLGYLQRSAGSLDLEACRRHGIPLVRRASGGRAVLHASELTYSVALPLDGPWAGLSVPETFGLIGRGLLAGLRQLGVEATVGTGGAGGADGPRAAACFLLPRMPAVLVGERKLIGSAQRRWERCVLQHGSLLLGFDPALHQAIFPAWPREDPADGVVSLDILLAGPPSVGDLMDGIAAGWSEAMEAPCRPAELTAAEARQAEALVRTRYGNPAWTFKR